MYRMYQLFYMLKYIYGQTFGYREACKTGKRRPV